MDLCGAKFALRWSEKTDGEFPPIHGNSQLAGSNFLDLKQGEGGGGGPELHKAWLCTGIS